MGKKRAKGQELNIINPAYYKKKKKVAFITWLLPLVLMVGVCICMMALVFYNIYDRENNKLKVDTYTINDKINSEFSIALNSINLNGYMEIFEQYMKTVETDSSASIYLENAVTTLDNITNLSDNIVTTFMISFETNALITSGFDGQAISSYDYTKESWYEEENVLNNQLYVSTGFKIPNVADKELFAIVRPVIDSMNDKPIGVVAFCYEEDYLKKVFDKAVAEKIDAVIYTDDGKVLFSTSSKKNIKKILDNDKKQRKYIKQKEQNEGLNWVVETYRTVTSVVISSLWYMFIVIVLFALMIYTYCHLLKKLYELNVIVTRDSMPNDKDNTERIEQKVKKEEYIMEEDLAFDEVLLDELEIEESFLEDEVIISGEIIYDKK